MPTYEYACGACGHQWEQVQRIVEAPVEVCPKCAQSSAHRLISGGTNFILKGGGWYSDLYSSAKAPAKTESTSTASSEGSKSESSKSESTTSESKAAPAASPAPAATSTPSTSTSSS